MGSGCWNKWEKHPTLSNSAMSYIFLFKMHSYSIGELLDPLAVPRFALHLQLVQANDTIQGFIGIYNVWLQERARFCYTASLYVFVEKSQGKI